MHQPFLTAAVAAHEERGRPIPVHVKTSCHNKTLALIANILTMSDDFEGEERLFHQMSARRIQPQYYDENLVSSSLPYRWRVFQVLDALTSSHFGIVITVLLIVLVHFRGTISYGLMLLVVFELHLDYLMFSFSLPCG